jgi:hypothetical protein
MTDEVQATPSVEESVEPARSGIDAAIDKAVAEVEARNAPASDADDEAPRKGNPYRAPDGKFTTKPDAPAEASTEPAEAVAEPATQTTVEPVSQPIEPPSRWSDADKAAFASLPREAQQVLLEMSKRQDGDYTRKTQEIAETRKAIEPFLQTVHQWSPHLQQINMHPVQAFDQAMRIDQILRYGNPQQKQSLVAEIAQFAGLQLPTASGEAQPQAATSQEWVDPQVQTLSQQVTGLQQALMGLQQESAQQQRVRAETEFAEIGRTKNQDGSAKYPHWDRVRDRMIKLVANGDADTWDDAYDQSIWSDRDLRDQIIASQKTAVAEAERQAEERRRQEAVTKARGAAPVATSGGTKGASKPKGLDAMLDSVLAAKGY